MLKAVHQLSWSQQARLRHWDAASAGRIAASEGEMGINNTDTKINRDMTIFLSLTIELNDFRLVILRQKIDYIAILDELIHHSQEIKHIATIRNICRHVLALGLLLNRIDVKRSKPKFGL